LEKFGEAEKKMLTISQVWWWMPVTPALGKLRQESHNLKSSLGYIASLRAAWAT
jgi:hypothetical protein